MDYLKHSFKNNCKNITFSKFHLKWIFKHTLNLFQGQNGIKGKYPLICINIK